MSSGHDHGAPAATGGRDTARRRVGLILPLMAVYMVAEIIGGWLTNSLALLADAGHMLSDVAALGLTLFAMWIARRPATATRTFGHYRAEILAALANGATLVVVADYLFVEAWQRLEVQRPLATVVIGGLVTSTLLTLLVVPTYSWWIGERSQAGVEEEQPATGTGP